MKRENPIYCYAIFVFFVLSDRRPYRDLFKTLTIVYEDHDGCSNMVFAGGVEDDHLELEGQRGAGAEGSDGHADDEVKREEYIYGTRIFESY